MSNVRDHPRAGEVLARVLAAGRRSGAPDPLRAVASLAADAGVPGSTLYRYHRDYAYPSRSFIRSWRIPGPVDGAGGYVRPAAQWQRYDTPAGERFITGRKRRGRTGRRPSSR